MRETLMVFLNGVGGVFLGMGVLYGAIKLMSLVVGLMEREEAK